MKYALKAMQCTPKSFSKLGRWTWIALGITYNLKEYILTENKIT
jgi:hypothetical protein